MHIRAHAQEGMQLFHRGFSIFIDQALNAGSVGHSSP